MRVTEANVDAVRKSAEAAVTNEQLTRRRVEHLEAILYRTFLGRLRWLILGR